MTLTQVFTRFLKEYLPQGSYSSWIVALANKNVITRTRDYDISIYSMYNRMLLNEDICFRYLMDNCYGRNVYGICGRLVETYLPIYFRNVDSRRFNLYVLDTYRKLWRNFVDEYVILPKKPSSFYHPCKEDLILANSFGIKKEIKRYSNNRAILRYDKRLKPWGV